MHARNSDKQGKETKRKLNRWKCSLVALSKKEMGQRNEFKDNLFMFL
jgi:hypothetical protein